MGRYILRRARQTAPTVLLASIGIFFLVRLIPGDPAVTLAGIDASPETVEAIREDLGLDQPIPVQLGIWLANVGTGDLGQSIQARRPVTELLALALPATVQLVVAATLVALVLGVTLGVLSAIRCGSWLDVAIGGWNSLIIGVPNFWLGLLAIILFALILDWLPPGGRVDPLQDPVLGIRSLVLPALVLGLGQGAVIARFTRAAMLEVTAQPYIRTAHAKGLASRTVATRHALRNALIPVITIVGIQIGHLLGGAVVIETVFAWPGVGRLVVNAVGGRDYPVIQGVLLVLMLAFVIVNLCTDLLYGVLDPRLRVTD